MAIRVPSGRPLRKYGHVHLRAPVFSVITTTLYPVRPEDDIAVTGGVTNITFRRVLEDYMSISASIVEFQIGPVYFPLDTNYKQDGQSDEDFHEDLEVSVDIIEFQVGGVYFPEDTIFKQEGQSDDEFHEDLEIAADVVDFQVGSVFFPIDYLNWPEEELDLELDIVEFTIEAA